jgi:hypothetical protein
MERRVKSFNEFSDLLQKDTTLQSEFQKDPLEAVRKIKEEHPLQWDRFIYRAVTLMLGIVVIIIAVGILLLVGLDKIENDQDVPTLLTAIGSAAVGAVAGLLSPSVRGSSD